MSRRKDEHPVEVHANYVKALRARIEAGPGVLAVATAAGISRRTVSRVLSDAHRGTPDAIERVRAALMKLEPGTPPLPPAVVSVRGPEHYAWIRLGERLLSKDPAALARALGAPGRLERAVLGGTAKRRAPRKART